MSECIKRIDWLERMRNSVSDNPRYRIHFTDGTVLETLSDVSVAYGLENPEYRDVPLKVSLTRTGKVWDIEPVTVDREA